MIVCGARVVIPSAKVPEMIKILIGMHQSATKMRQRARLSGYWPHMDKDIANAAKDCDSCISRLPSPPAEPLCPHEPATRPFQFVHADIGEEDGRHFLVIVDQFSGWPDVSIYDGKNTTAHRLAKSSRALFSTMGAPEGLWSDNQPFEAAEYQDFLRKYNVSWHSSSLHYPQSNGRAEAEIKPIKKTRLRLQDRWQVGCRLDDPNTNALQERPALRGRPVTSRKHLRPTHSRWPTSPRPLIQKRMAKTERRARTPHRGRT